MSVIFITFLQDFWFSPTGLIEVAYRLPSGVSMKVSFIALITFISISALANENCYDSAGFQADSVKATFVSCSPAFDVKVFSKLEKSLYPLFFFSNKKVIKGLIEVEDAYWKLSSDEKACIMKNRDYNFESLQDSVLGALKDCNRN